MGSNACGCVTSSCSHGRGHDGPPPRPIGPVGCADSLSGMTVTTSNHGVLKANDPCWCGSGKKFKRCHKTANTNIRPGRQSPMRPVPPEIPRPPYAESGEVVRHPVSPVTPPDVIERMRVAGRAAAEVLDLTAAAVAPGVPTDEIAAICHQACLDPGGSPSPPHINRFPHLRGHPVNQV